MWHPVVRIVTNSESGSWSNKCRVSAVAVLVCAFFFCVCVCVCALVFSLCAVGVPSHVSLAARALEAILS